MSTFNVNMVTISACFLRLVVVVHIGAFSVFALEGHLMQTALSHDGLNKPTSSRDVGKKVVSFVHDGHVVFDHADHKLMRRENRGLGMALGHSSAMDSVAGQQHGPMKTRTMDAVAGQPYVHANPATNPIFVGLTGSVDHFRFHLENTTYKSLMQFVVAFTVLLALIFGRPWEPLKAHAYNDVGKAFQNDNATFELEMVLMSGEVVAKIAVSEEDTGSQIKSRIAECKKIKFKIAQILIGGCIVEDDKKLTEHGPFTGNRAAVRLVRHFEWRLLTLEGKWLPTRLQDWRPKEWHTNIKERVHDGNTKGFAFDVYGGKRPRGPYRLTSQHPPTWESKIAGPSYMGMEQLKLLPGGTLELCQKRSNSKEKMVFFYVRETVAERVRNFFLEKSMLLLPWQSSQRASTVAAPVPGKDWLDAI